MNASRILALIGAGFAIGCHGPEQPGTDTAKPEPAAVQTPPTVPGPIEGTRITEAYARMVARDLYVWAWPMVNVYNRRVLFAQLPEPGLLGGVLPAAPPNQLTMLTDYIKPEQRDVACPNQDVAYGGGTLALDVEPAVIQVPDFGDRFWVYQIVDLRTDSFVNLGKMYDTKPGFYLLVGPDWKGDTPQGIAQVFRSGSHTGFVIPRVYLDDTDEDRAAIQPVISQIDMYPLSKFDGKMKQRSWADVPSFPAPPPTPGGGEAPKVDPEKFFDELPVVLKDAPPLPGEEAQYATAAALITAASQDPKLKAAIVDEAIKADKEIVAPLVEFRNFGIPRSRTSSSTSPMRRRTSTRTSMNQAPASTARIGTSSRSPRVSRR